MKLEIKHDCKVNKVLIIGPGPSLTQADVDYVRKSGIFTIIVGNVYQLHPTADILYHCDKRWWKHHDGALLFFGKQRVSYEDTGMENVLTVESSPLKEGLDFEAPRVVTGRHSGYQALNLAVHYQPEEIYLLGYDMKVQPGQYAFYGNSQLPTRANGWGPLLHYYDSALPFLDEKGIKVYNCSVDTALTQFERKPLREVI